MKACGPTLTFDGKEAAGIQATFGRYRTMSRHEKGPAARSDRAADRRQLGRPPVEDPIGQKNGSLYVRGLRPARRAGRRRTSGTLTLQGRRARHSTLTVSLNVWDFTLPDYLSFLPEMNCYGLPRTSATTIAWPTGTAPS